MKKIEAPTLEEAYKRASDEFNCSITELSYEIIQYPRNGLFGLFKRKAIIVVARKVVEDSSRAVEQSVENRREVKKEDTPTSTEVKQPATTVDDDRDRKSLISNDDKVLDNFFASSKNSGRDISHNINLASEIEKSIDRLMKSSCFNIDTVKVEVFNNIAHVFIDGRDAALLIGKEGYRYNALSYMLFNWVNDRYGLYLKLEIAEFIKTQEEMIENYLKPIIEHIEKNGRGKTKPLDGILVQIALEKLRDRFPNKYVAIKTSKDNSKFIVINNFNTTKS
ncbi:MAG: protein jag [Epsilonproteobacteria bacterium]|nr:protein jag [Campylobacterota bacterium]